MRAINGYLDSANLTGALNSDHVRDQSLASGKGVAATGNLDCIAQAYTRALEEEGSHIPIPGASIEFFLPYDPSLVIITWNISAGNSIGKATVEESQLHFFVDGAGVPGTKRRVGPCRLGANATTGQLYDDQDFRHSGHTIITDMTKGFHSASLRLFVGSDMVRVRVRDMKVIWFR